MMMATKMLLVNVISVALTLASGVSVRININLD